MENLPEILFEAGRVWAIPLFNSKRRIWKDENDFYELTYQWDDVGVNALSSYKNILIAVAGKYPDHFNKEIENIAAAIFTFSRLGPGDGIFGIGRNNEIKKTGRILPGYSLQLEHSIKLTFEWFDHPELKNIRLPSFNQKVEIQKISPEIIDNLGLTRTEDIESVYESYKSIRSMEYTGAMFRDIGREYSPKKEKAILVSLFYGTNRNYVGKGCNDFYGNQLDDLKFGMCQVRIPEGHIQGEVERPASIWKFHFPEKEEKHIVIKQINELTEKEFLEQLIAVAANDPEKTAMIFIHGYNTSFAEAAWRTGQIACDVPFNGLAGFFSWPSSGQTASYFADIEKADSSIPDLERFIRKIIGELQIEKLHLIAHSMGNRILTVSLNNLSKDTAIQAQLGLIKQIVLAAPDIDRDVFNNTILPQLKTVGERRTLYSSDKDKALHVSEIMRGKRQRLGFAGNLIFVADGLDTVDASNVPSPDNHHSYIFDTRELLADLYYLLGQGFAPSDRRLRPRDKEGLKYWLFPE